MAVPSYFTTGEKIAHYSLRVFVMLVLLFLISPIIAVMPLSFNSESFFTYPMPGYSLKWYEDFFFNDRWTGALRMSFFIAICTTILATFLGTLAALGLARTNFPAKCDDHGHPDLADDRSGDHLGGRHVQVLCAARPGQHAVSA